MLLRQKQTKNYFYGGRYFVLCLITKLTLTLTLKPCASEAEYSARSTRKIASVAEKVTELTLTLTLTMMHKN